ncbi:sodium-dependent glucose transporter 1A-like [Tetranychus urticae]|uniref:sodium-dependent glucose transporter 1A-like n=1 Tax=Tetranychus urticae TaxID=32264 RepID=UPI00077BDF02|nr:sodium-dependent glucose transporter 1A-like [Tetranychus urticae]
MELNSQESATSISSLFSSILSKRVGPSRLRLKHRHKARDSQVSTFPKIVKLVAACCCFLEIGIATSLSGATLLDLKVALGTVNDKESLIILNLSAGDVAGTIIGGYLADRMRIEKLSSANLIVMALAGYALNLTKDRGIIFACFIIFGFTTAFLEIVMEVWIMNLWAGYGGTITHVAYFFFGLGTFVGPFLVSPFLDESPKITVTNSNQTKIDLPMDNSSNVFIPYKILAHYSLFLSIFLVIICIAFDKNDNQSSIKGRHEDKNSKVDLLYIIIMGFFFLLSQSINGLDSSFGLLVMNFSIVSATNFTKKEGVQLSASFWCAYTFTRIITMSLMRYISDRALMWTHLAITGSGIILLLIFYPSNLFLWISTIIIGAGISPTSPLVLSYFNHYIKVTGKIATVFMLAGCLGEFIYPTLMDYFLSRYPLSFVYINIFNIFSAMVYFFLLDKFILKREERLNFDQDEVYVD